MVPDDRADPVEVGAEGFFAIDMRTGRVTDVEPFPEARKPAWKLTVDFGPVIGTLRTIPGVRIQSGGAGNPGSGPLQIELTGDDSVILTATAANIL